MTTLATEPWTATSTTAWPAQWTAGVNQGTASVASTRGRLTPSGTGYKTIRRLLAGMGTSTAPRQITGTFIMSAVTEQYIRLSGRESVGTTGAYPTGYFVRVDPGVGTWKIYGGYGTGEYGDAAAVTLPMAANQVYGYTILVSGATTSARLWNVTAGQTEPTTWQSTWTDTDYAGDGGVPALSQQSGSTTNPYVEFGPVTVTDGATTTTVAFTGGGTLATTGSPKPVGTLARTGTGTTTRTSTPALTAAVPRTGGGSLAPSAGIVFTVASPQPNDQVATLRPAFTGTGTPTGSVSVFSDQTGYELGTTTVAADGSWTITPTVDVDPGNGSYFIAQTYGTSYLYVDLPITAPREVTIARTGGGDLSSVGVPMLTSGSPLSSTGTLTAGGSPAVTGATARAGSGTLTVDTTAAFTGAVDRTADGTLTVTGTPTAGSPLALASTGALAAAGTPGFTAPLPLTATGTLALAGQGSSSGSGTLASTGGGTLTAKGAPAFAGTALLASTDTLTLGAAVTIPGTVALTGSGVLTVTGQAGHAEHVLTLTLTVPRRTLTLDVPRRAHQVTVPTRPWRIDAD